jgi:hypothetical protein
MLGQPNRMLPRGDMSRGKNARVPSSAAKMLIFAPMPRKPLDLPMRIAKAFIKDMRAFHAEPNEIKRDEIAGRQMDALRQFQGPREKPVRIPHIKEMFEQMKDEG